MFINFDQYVNPDLYDIWPMSRNSIIPMISPKKGKNFTEVVEKFRDAAVQTGGKMKVFERNEIPENLHFNYKNRVGELLIIMEAPWKFDSSKFGYRKAMPANVTWGTHGYNTSCKGMRPFFIAHGPAFKQGHRGQPIHSVDLYPLICHLLGIQPAPNNGSLDRVRELLRERKKEGLPLSLGTNLVSGIVILAALIIACLGVLVLLKWRKLRGETSSVQLRPGAQNENNPQQRDWERGVWDLVFHSYYANLNVITYAVEAMAIVFCLVFLVSAGNL